MKKIIITITLITLAVMFSTVAFGQSTRKSQRSRKPATNRATQDVFVTEVVGRRKPNNVSVFGMGGGVDERSAANASQPRRRVRSVPAPTPSPITKRRVPRPTQSPKPKN
ncbi:MAG TPA: hypothetical protein VFZ34_23845 [Blastocatellia bacterium]|nr:hypothetical protein [Blastocatellia bacterium]